jgi:hypothetical protein
VEREGVVVVLLVGVVECRRQHESKKKDFN